MPKLLLIEDDPLLLEHMVPGLQRHGHEVRVAENAKEALTVLASDEDFDVVILDVMLPLMGAALDDPTEGLEAGVKILEKVRQDETYAHRRSIPFLCYTVRGVSREIREALEALGGVVLTKGGDPAEVLNMIDQLIQQKGQ